MKKRSDTGKFVSNSDEPREVRTIRATNSIWEEMGAIAEAYGMTRADLLEGLLERRFILDPMAMGKLSSDEEEKESLPSVDESVELAKKNTQTKEVCKRINL